MPVNIQDLIDVLAQLSEERNLRATVAGSLKGGLLTGSSAVVGGLMLGPVGLAIGGIIGGTAAALSTKNSFKPVAIILKDMSPKQKKQLYDKVKHAFRNFGIQDVATIAGLILSNTALQELAVREVSNYLSNEMNLKVQL